MSIDIQLDTLFRDTVFPSNAARQVQPVTQNLLKQRECLIRYEQPDKDGQVMAALEWFETYADAANRNPQKWIDRPYISATERLPGRWRLVTVRTASERGEDPGIYLLLREGWATSLVQSEARFSGVQGNPADGTLSFTRYWPNIDPDKTAALAATLKTTATVTDPLINNVKQSGTFAVSGVSSQVMDGDGSGVVSQVLTQMTALTITSPVTGTKIATALASWPYLIQPRENTIIQPFNFETGTGDTETLVFANMHPSDETRCMQTVAGGELATALASGWTFANRMWRKESNGTCTFAVLFRKIAWNAWSGNTKNTFNTIDYTNHDRDGERREKTWELIQTADLTKAMTFLTNDANADAGFHVVRVNPVSNGDGAFSVTQSIVAKVQESAVTDGNLLGQQVNGVHGFHKSVMDTLESVYDNFSEAELAALVDAVPNGYKLVSVTPGLTGDGLFRKTFSYEKLTVRAWGKNYAGGAYTAPDTTEYDNAGTQNEREGITKTWNVIRIADIATATAALRTGSTGYAAETGYVITGVNVSGGQDGAFSISQRQKKQVKGIDVTGMRLIDPHAFQEGVATTVTTRYEHFTEADILNATVGNPANKTPGTFPGVISNEVEGPNGDGLFSRTIVEQTVAWQLWVTGTGSEDEPYSYATYDIRETLNPGTDRQGYESTWFGIRQADCALALADLVNGTAVPPESGYIITGARVRPGPMGSLTLVQTQAKQLNPASVSGAEVIRPHSLQPGAMATVTIRYENFLAGTLPTPASKVPGTNAGVISNDVQGPDANGFYSRVIVQQTPTWRLWATAAGSPDNIEYESRNTKKERKTRQWLGIQQDDRHTAADILATPESGYVVNAVRFSDYAPGAVVITQYQSLIAKGASKSELEADRQIKIQPHNFVSGTVDRVTIINEDLPDPSSGYVTLSSSKTGYTLIDSDERFQGDGRWTVYHIYEKVTWPAFLSDKEDEDGQKIATGYSFVVNSFPEGTPVGGPPVSVREKIWLNVRKADITSATAYLWDNTDSGFLVDEVKPQNNGDGSIDLIQVTSKIVTSYSKTWEEANGTYVTVEEFEGVVTGWERFYSMWKYELKYFTTEEAARTWFGTAPIAYGSQLSRITPNAWRAVKITKATDLVMNTWHDLG